VGEREFGADRSKGRDWLEGVVTPHGRGLRHYEVSFYASCTTATNDPKCVAQVPSSLGKRLVYIMSYDYDPASLRGFVYLPGKDSPFYYVNMGSIARGCEGNWFLARDSWEAFVRPLIARALKCYGCLT
jgi:hypothetical protein